MWAAWQYRLPHGLSVELALHRAAANRVCPCLRVVGPAQAWALGGECRGAAMGCAEARCVAPLDMSDGSVGSRRL